MPRNHSAQTKASGKYFLEVSGEEKGNPERKNFQKREDALAFAERQETRKIGMRVTNFNGKEIYCSQ